jgi:hypothetical protein
VGVALSRSVPSFNPPPVPHASSSFALRIARMLKLTVQTKSFALRLYTHGGTGSPRQDVAGCDGGATTMFKRQQRPIDLYRLELMREYKQRGEPFPFFKSEGWQQVKAWYAALPADRKLNYEARARLSGVAAKGARATQRRQAALPGTLSQPAGNAATLTEPSRSLVSSDHCDLCNCPVGVNHPPRP